MSVCDGATIRRERILDMLAYIRRFMPNGCPTNQIGLYMSMNHGLKQNTTLGYLYEMQQGGIVAIQNARVLINISNFKRMIELMAPDRDPDTGSKLEGDFNLAILGAETVADVKEKPARKAKAPKAPKEGEPQP